MEVPEETKDPNPVLPESSAPAGGSSAPAGEPAAATPPDAKPAPAAAKPAAPPAKPAPPKPEGPKPEPWDSDLVNALKSQYGSGIAEASTYLGQKYLVVDCSILDEILLRMHDEQF